MTSIKDVAKAAGVSTATVSRVLSNKPYVKPELRKRVLDAVENLNYRPNLVARSLRAKKSNIIGLIVADIRNPYFTAISRSVEDTAYEQGYSVFLCNTDENPEKEKIYIQLMRDENVAGVIFAPTRKIAKNLNSQRLDFPMVLVDRGVPIDEESAFDVVLIDNADSAYRLTCHLLEQGYHRIAGIFGEKSFTGKERERGYKRALKEYKSSLSPEYTKYVAPKKNSGKKATEQLIKLTPRPDAIFTTNSLLTAGAMTTIVENQLIVPDDVALVGFDDPAWTTLVKPQITVIAQPTQEIGRMATELLLQRIEEPKMPAREVTLRGKLIKRGSV